jgi:glucose-1-phosphate cytidylyltransferase
VAIGGLETVLILCGGRGTRLHTADRQLPKPLVEIGGEPILWHVMQIYASQGARRFVLCTGYQGEAIEAFVAGRGWPDGVEVECLDTGEDTPTGGRVKRAQSALGGEAFLATYADGVADIDLRELVAHHAANGGAATMTVVRPELPFGVTELGEDGRVAGFHEKPRAEQWVNGGFFCFEPAVFDYLTDSSVLERAPLEGLAGDGELFAYRHTGFWECLDTYKDAVQLNDLWASGAPPWRTWTPA